MKNLVALEWLLKATQQRVNERVIYTPLLAVSK